MDNLTEDQEEINDFIMEVNAVPDYCFYNHNYKQGLILIRKALFDLEF